MVLFQNDPFRDFDLMLDRMSGRPRTAGPAMMAMDAYRRDSDVWVHLDMPGMSPESIDISLERNVLTVAAAREWTPEDDDQVYISERRRGEFTRQVHLGDGLDGDGIEADYHAGVLTLRIPIAERAQPKKIEVGSGRVDAIDVASTAG